MIQIRFKCWYIAICAGLMTWTQCVYAEEWPVIPIPDDVRAFSVADNMEVNGITMQVYAYFSKQSVMTLQSWYKKNTSFKWSINSLGKKQILGAPIENFYVTVQLEDLGFDNTKAIVSTTRVKNSEVTVKNYLNNKLLWSERLPIGTVIKLLSQSFENGKQTLYLQAFNNVSVLENERYILHALKQLGYYLDPFQMKENANSISNQDPHLSKGKLLFLSHKNGDAVLALTKVNDGATSIAITLSEKNK